MFSIFPGDGARFANHIDNTTGDGRILTVVTYLNPDWKEDNGGALRVQIPSKYQSTHSGLSSVSASLEQNVVHEISNASEEKFYYVDVLPACGRVVLFFSSEIPHEVMPTYGNRHACTIWYYDRKEREEALKKAAESGEAFQAAVADIESQTEARNFIAELMGEADDENAMEINEETLRELNQKVVELSDEAVKIVSSITGAPSPESFRTGFPMLTPTDLKNIRVLFRRMGLQ